MVMMSIHLTGEVPFNTVYLHAMVRDAHGRKMSKSLGNVIDPIQVIEGISLEGLHETLTKGNLDERELKKAREGQKQDFPDGIEECGTDALRFALCAYTSQARDINLDIKRVIGYRHWCNKLWNAIRFGMMNIGDFVPVDPAAMNVVQLPVGCQWAMSRLNAAIESAVSAMESYNFTGACTAIYAFWQYEVCDVFIEIAKPFFGDSVEPAERTAWRQVLWCLLETGMRLLHPFMPFVTEELWQRLPKVEGSAVTKSIMLTSYPARNEAWTNAIAERQMSLADSITRSVRNIRSQYGLVKQKPSLFVVVADEAVKSDAKEVAGYVQTLTLSSDISVTSDPAPKNCAGAHVSETLSAYLDMAGVLDPVSELKKLDKKLAEINKNIETLSRKMALPTYESKTPEKIKDENAERLEKYQKEKTAVEKMQEDFRSL